MFRISCLLVCALLVGCGGGDALISGRQAPPKQARVDWLGHECFLLTSSLGTSILTNPYPPGTTSRTLRANLKPDIVLVSNEQPECNNVDAMENTPSVFRGAMGVGSNNTAGIHVRGVAIYDNPEKPDSSGFNLVFAWKLEGIRFCFLGNIPRALNTAEIQDIGEVDVLFVPVGVPSGLADTTRRTIVEQLRPRVVIPMGRETEFTPFGSSLGKVHQIQGTSVLLAPEALPTDPTALIFGSP